MPAPDRSQTWICTSYVTAAAAAGVWACAGTASVSDARAAERADSDMRNSSDIRGEQVAVGTVAILGPPRGLPVRNAGQVRGAALLAPSRITGLIRRRAPRIRTADSG
ncbi:hypothetical protein [Streptomyces sp. ST1020]|uniref:hypothetical protein n=1 Tax=Streptomyces sp. ST1020 TaxID=1848901 RepID=UPI0013A69558|nr:hypothetical protein [Streptomyces sp. ST1020]